ncbi:unnamed protein product [Aspergillus oryzae]|uniref:Unnamed protein product n=1 Tax=Aspergillus oryzae TaxID=5062 RepID=A0AAN4YS51_ASPOZ|nr:unnamed protein product [Aspergillus oryzae]
MVETPGSETDCYLCALVYGREQGVEILTRSLAPNSVSVLGDNGSGAIRANIKIIVDDNPSPRHHHLPPNFQLTQHTIP